MARELSKESSYVQCLSRIGFFIINVINKTLTGVIGVCVCLCFGEFAANCNMKLKAEWQELLLVMCLKLIAWRKKITKFEFGCTIKLKENIIFE